MANVRNVQLGYSTSIESSFRAMAISRRSTVYLFCLVHHRGPSRLALLRIATKAFRLTQFRKMSRIFASHYTLPYINLGCRVVHNDPVVGQRYHLTAYSV